MAGQSLALFDFKPLRLCHPDGATLIGRGCFSPAGLARAGALLRDHAVSDDDILSGAREAFQLAADAEGETRREALADIRFARLGEEGVRNGQRLKGDGQRTSTGCRRRHRPGRQQRAA